MLAAFSLQSERGKNGSVPWRDDEIDQHAAAMGDAVDIQLSRAHAERADEASVITVQEIEAGLALRVLDIEPVVSPPRDLRSQRVPEAAFAPDLVHLLARGEGFCGPDFVEGW